MQKLELKNLQISKRMKHEDLANTANQFFIVSEKFDQIRRTLFANDVSTIILEILFGKHTGVYLPIILMEFLLSICEINRTRYFRLWNTICDVLNLSECEIAKADNLGYMCIKGLLNLGPFTQPTISGDIILDYILNSCICKDKEEFDSVFPKLIETYRVCPTILISEASKKGFLDGLTLVNIKKLFGIGYENNPFYWTVASYIPMLSIEDRAEIVCKGARMHGHVINTIEFEGVTLFDFPIELKAKYSNEAMELKPPSLEYHLDLRNERIFIKNLLLMARHYSMSCIFHNIPLEIFSIILKLSGIYPPPPFF
jgi:hypothetical protein